MQCRQVKAIREKLGLSQAELAQELGVAPLTVSQWETGYRKPSPLALRALKMLEELSKRDQRELADIKRRLKQSFEKIQLKHFRGELSRDYRLELSRRMKRTQGLSIPSQRVIRLSLPHLKELGWEALEATLRHEMVHCWLFERGRPWGHSPEFKAKLKEIEEDR